ncbi:MAG: hypothetical protein JRH18_01030 [Deltaproteobacteria bacterium]|nr:hypothetical protein [Deltaproteobacteria bacterium]MBW2150231.1 hypothetical protein [Deltaproteobacteria bacterium]
MKRLAKIIFSGLLLSTLIVFGATFFTGLDTARACGWGGSGGQGYVPQRRDGSGDWFASKPSLTKEQALNIVTNHVKKLNPDLKVGRINDAGSFFEAEILSEDNEVVQLIGVDKASGRLMIIN